MSSGKLGNSTSFRLARAIKEAQALPDENWPSHPYWLGILIAWLRENWNKFPWIRIAVTFLLVTHIMEEMIINEGTLPQIYVTYNNYILKNFGN